MLAMRTWQGLRGEAALHPTMRQLRVPGVADGGHAVREPPSPPRHVVRRDLPRHRRQGRNLRQAAAQDDRGDLAYGAADAGLDPARHSEPQQQLRAGIGEPVHVELDDSLVGGRIRTDGWREYGILLLEEGIEIES